MKHCEEFEALLDLYVDGELAAEEMLRVQKHLDQCPECQAYVDDLLAIRAAFPEVEDTIVPEGFAEGVMSAIAASAPKAKKRPTPWKKVLIPMAACLALVVMAMPLRGMMGGKAEEAAAEPASTMMESPAEMAVASPAEMPVEEPAEAPASAADEGAAMPSAEGGVQYAHAPEQESSTKRGRIATESKPFADVGDPEMSTITTGGPAATITLPPEGAQLELLLDRAPDRETASRMEFDLPAADYETLLNQLDESGLDYIAEEYTGSTGTTILVIIELELAAQN